MNPDDVGKGTPLVYSKFSPGLEHRLLADDPRTANLLQPALRIGDAPVAGLELDRLAAEICEHMVYAQKK